VPDASRLHVIYLDPGIHASAGEPYVLRPAAYRPL